MQYHHAILAGPLWPTNDMTTWLRMLHLEAGIPWSIRTQRWVSVVLEAHRHAFGTWNTVS